MRIHSKKASDIVSWYQGLSNPEPRDLANAIDELIAEEVFQAYKRGAVWIKQNQESPEYLTKAAADYVDKITAPEQSS